MESCAANTTLDHDVSTLYTAAETGAISQLTAELLCTDILKELYVAAVRDDDIGADKLYEQLRCDLKSLGLFIQAEDRALWKFAEALQHEVISNGLSRAIVTYAQELVSSESAVDKNLEFEDPALTAEPEPTDDARAAIANHPPRTQPARPTFHLPSPTAHALLDLGAYAILTPQLIDHILHSKRYLSLRSQLLDLVFDAYAQRLATAIGLSALGEDDHVLRWSRLQTAVDELTRTPPHKISYAAHGTRAARVIWTRKTFVDGEEKEVKVEAPELQEGFCRVRWTSKEGFVRFVDVRVGSVRGIMDVVRGAPGLRGFVVC